MYVMFGGFPFFGISVGLDVTQSLEYYSFSNFLFYELNKCSIGAVFFRIIITILRSE